MLSPSISKMLNDDPQNLPSKVTKPVHQQKEEREKYTRAGPQSHTHKRNPILVEEQTYVQYSCSRPLHHIFQMGALLARPGSTRWKKHISRYENISMHL